MKLAGVRFTVKTKAPEKALTKLIRKGIPFTSPRREKDGLSFSVTPSRRGMTVKWCKEQEYEARWQYEGAITYLSPLRHRPGIVFGTFLALFLIYLSTFYVWSVRIEGNSRLSDKEIIQLLEECGFGEGSRKNAVDVNEIQNTALARCHELSFLSVNIHGAVADVVVHERVLTPPAEDKEHPYNLVADADGVIVDSLILDGQVMVNRGDTVFKGQLLVSGLVDRTATNPELKHARGKVYANTHRTVTVSIPLKVTEKRYTRQEQFKGIRVLGHSIYTQKPDDSRLYDESIEETELRFLGLLLPMVRETRYVDYYTEEEVFLTRDEAKEKAYSDYQGYISTELDSAEITKESFIEELKDDTFTLTAEITAIENIAREQKIQKTE